MGEVLEELEEAKAKIETLNLEYKNKTELSENLKRGHSELLSKLQEATLKIEKQSLELNEKVDENNELKKLCEDLNCCLIENESIIKGLRSANDKLRVEGDEKYREWEEEKRRMVLKLEESDEKRMDQEQSICACREEIEGLKRSLSISQKKCSEIEENAKTLKEFRERDNAVLNLEDECRKVKEQLKWKKEQFDHLEEAIKKLRDQFKMREKEWETEKSILLDEISSLQTNLNSQTRNSKDLQNKLEMCSQALAHEESRRRNLQVQVSEYEKRIENCFVECDEDKLKLEDLASQRDKEIAALRHAIGTKDSVNKEMKYQNERLVQENHELREALKETQEAQIQLAGPSSSMGKLRNKLKSLEIIHKDCTSNLKAKEAEWSSQLEKMVTDLDNFKSTLEEKESSVKMLKAELEDQNSLIIQLKLENEELSVFSLVIRQGISEAQVREALKETQEAQIQLAGPSSSMGKLRNKLKSLEIIHKDCTSNLKAKEAEWSSQLEKMVTDLDNFKSTLEEKESSVKMLKAELEDQNSLIIQLKLENEELSVFSLVIRQGISEAQVRIENENAEINLHEIEREENVVLLMKKLEILQAALVEAQTETNEEHHKVVDLERRMESLAVIEEQQQLNLKELEWFKERLEESCECQLQLKEQISQAEHDAREKLREVCDALDRANVELDEKERRVKSLEVMEDQHHLIQKKFDDRSKEIFEESSSFQFRLREQVLQMENVAKQKLEEACDELDRANSELAEKDKRIKSLELIQEKHFSSQKELDEYKEMLKESSRYQLRLKEQLINMEQAEKAVSEKLREVLDTLDRTKAELEEKERRLESLEVLEGQNILNLKIFEESSGDQLGLSDRLLLIECDAKERLKEACDALNRTNDELIEKICEGNEIEFELYIWKSFVERLKTNLEESHQIRRELEASLLAQIDIGEIIKLEKDELQQQLLLQEETFKVREIEVATEAVMDRAMCFESEKDGFLQTVREKDEIVEQLQKEVVILEHESLRRELEGAILAHLGAERTFDKEKNKLIQLIEDKNMRVNDLMQLVQSLEKKFITSLTSFSSQLVEKQEEMNLVQEAWEKITAAETLAVIEIEEKKKMIMQLEEDIHAIQEKLEQQGVSLAQSEEQALKIEAEMEAKELEMKKLTDQMKTKLTLSNAVIDELRTEKSNLLEDVMKLSSEREDLVSYIGGIGDKISEFSIADKELMGLLEKMMNLKLEDDKSIYSKENKADISTAMKKFEASLAMRSPFRELNHS